MKDDHPKLWTSQSHARQDTSFWIVTSVGGNPIYIDGFAGRGRYNDGSEGPRHWWHCDIVHLTIDAFGPP